MKLPHWVEKDIEGLRIVARCGGQREHTDHRYNPEQIVWAHCFKR